MTDPIRYRAEPAANLRVQPLDDITLIYHRRSGQTHMVMSPVPEILDSFDGHDLGGHDVQLDLHAILATLADRYDIGDPAEAAGVIAAHLDDMAALGLVHRG